MNGKRSVVPPDLLTPEEVKVVLRTVKDSTAKSAMKLIYTCGLRPEETVKVMAEDLRNTDTGKKLLKVTVSKTPKGETTRWIELSQPASAIVEEQLKTGSASCWLFPEGSTHISAESLKRTFEIGLVKSGIRKKVSLGSLRKSFALSALGSPHKAASNLFHHCRTCTTEHYLRPDKG